MNRSPGFTLIELILTVAILAILAAVAVPSISEFINRYRNEARGRELFELIVFMRTKAFGEGRIYTLCPIGDGDTCGRNWSKGALLFEDSNGNKKLDQEEIVHRILQPLSDNASLNWNSLHSHYLQFRPSGLTRSQSGNFAYCPPSRKPEDGWIIVLNSTGRPYFGRDGNGDGIAENGSGINLQC